MTGTDIDNLVAAIFAATMCGTKKTADPEEFLQVQEMFIEIIKARNPGGFRNLKLRPLLPPGVDPVEVLLEERRKDRNR